jgi:hypothetical protein
LIKQSKFKLTNRSNLFDKSFSFLFDGQISNKILFSFHPKLTNNDVCFNNVPNPNELTTSKIINGTKLCITNNVKDMIGCLGGIKVLFPLFLQLDQYSYSHQNKDDFNPYLINEIFALILNFIRDHNDNLEDMIFCKGFQIIRFLFLQISPKHITEETIKYFMKLLTVCKDCKLFFKNSIIIY